MTLAMTFPLTGFATSLLADRALSGEASELRKLTRNATGFSESMALGETKRLAQEALYVAWLEAQTDDWDHAGARKSQLSTLDYADQFLQLLPSNVLLPEVNIDTDGEVLFEWDYGPRRILTVSVGRDGTLSFSGLFGHTDKIHGTTQLFENIPMVIADCLERLPTSAKP